MPRPVRVVLLCLLALFVAAPIAQAKVPKAPGGDALYKPPKKLGKYTHGDVIWGRKVGNGPLKQAARTWLVLYRSTSVAGKAIGVSGTIALPKGKPPKGGWPIISWAHGTSGISDNCTPSRDPNAAYTAYVAPQQNYWLKQGYAIASTDYEGLGTPGLHPYLVGRSEGRGVLDIARASRSVDHRVGRKLLIAGHSQGGHAALFAAALAPGWTPDLKFRGVAAFAPASHLSVLADALPTLTTPSPLSGLAGLVLVGLATAYPQIDPNKIASDAALAVLPQTKTKCVGELTGPGSLGGLAPSTLIRQGADLSPLHNALVKENPNLKIKAPVLILQGEADTTVFPFLTDQLDTELKARAGNRVEYKKYPGIDHVGIVAAADARTRAFLKARLG